MEHYGAVSGGDGGGGKSRGRWVGDVAFECHIHQPVVGKVIIPRNVIQVVFLIFNHVERIWRRPRRSFLPLSLSHTHTHTLTHTHSE